MEKIKFFFISFRIEKLIQGFSSNLFLINDLEFENKLKLFCSIIASHTIVIKYFINC